MKLWPGDYSGYSLNTFTEDIELVEEIFKWFANYLSDVKKPNSWTMEEIHKKGTWHNEAQTDEVNFKATFDDHQNILIFIKYVSE